MELSNIRKFVVAQGFLVLLLVFTAYFAATNLNQSLALTLELTSLQEVVQAADNIKAALEEERISIGQYPLTGNEELITRIENAQTDYDQNWEVIVQNMGTEQPQDIADIEDARETYKGMLDEIITEYKSNPENNKAAKMLSGAINYYLQNLEPKISNLTRPVLEHLSATVEQEKTRAINLSIFSKGAVGLSVIVGLFVIVQVVAATIVSRRIINAMQNIVNAADSISRGDMDVVIDVEQGGEIGDLARAIDRMRISLRAAIERLRR